MTPSIDELVVGDDPAAWVGAGFTVDDDAVSRVGTVRIRLVGPDGGRGIRSWSLRDTVPAEVETWAGGSIDGLLTTASEREPASGATHPLGVTAIDHLVLASPDSARTTAALESVGFDVRRVRRTDSYGSPMSQTFFRAGEVVLELVSPLEPGADGRPAAFFGLAFTVDDLAGAADRLGPAMSASKDAVQPGRRIATLRHRDLGLSVAIALMSPEPA